MTTSFIVLAAQKRYDMFIKTLGKNETVMSIPVQIAFQGGGARLALFYGAISALQKLEEDEIIRVTRVSGASAGAIAAALFAGRANIPALLEHHRSIDRNLVAKAFPDLSKSNKLTEYISAGKAAFFNTTLGDEKAFASVLEQALGAAQVKVKTVGELQIPCFLNTTDIINHRSEYAGQGDMLIQSLVNSAALPFLFRNSGEKIDGGILDNLPIDILGTSKEIVSPFGRIIAISFPPDKYTSQVTTAVDLAKRLLETVINDKVNRTKEILGSDNVLELPIEFDRVKLSTFSTDSYFHAAGSSTIVDNVRLSTIQWVRDWAAAEERNQAGPIVGSSRDANKLNMIQLKGLADTLHKNSKLLLRETIFEVTACCLQEGAVQKDKLDFIDTFETGPDPVFSYVARMSINSEAPTGDSTVKIYNSGGDYLASRQFVIADEAAKAFWTMVILDKAVHPSTDEFYTVRSKQTAHDIMRPLVTKGADYLSIEVDQAEHAGVAEIRLFVPENIKLDMQNGTASLMSALQIECYDSPRDEARLKKGEKVRTSARNSGSCPSGYEAYIWRGENLKKGDILRVVYTVIDR